MEHRKYATPVGSELEGVVMSFGNMNTFIDIVVLKKSKDEEGFATAVYDAVASVRAYREGRHGSQRWANLAAFSEATDLFRFRSIPGITVTTGHVIMTGGETFESHLWRM